MSSPILTRLLSLFAVAATALLSCDNASSPTAPQSSLTGNGNPVTVGDFVVTTSYDGADTIPTVAIKAIEGLSSQGPVDVKIKNTGTAVASVNVSVAIQDYTSSPGEATRNVGPGETITVSPMVFIDPAKLATLTTYTQSNYQVKVTTTINGSTQTLLSETHLVNLMAKDAMPWYLHGQDLTPFIALFVTPTNPAIVKLLATAKSYWSGNSFIGYQGTTIDSGTTADSGSLPASVASTFLGPTTDGHGFLSVAYNASSPLYLELVDGNDKSLFATPAATAFPAATYSFEGGSWKIVNPNNQGAKLSYAVEYWYTNNTVRDQVKAIYDALKAMGVTYSSTTISFPAGSQKVRFPADAINEAAANCIDGTVLIASALEAIGIEPQIILVPGHAFLGWKESAGSSYSEFLETTMIGTATFEAALQKGAEEFAQYSKAGTAVVVDLTKARELGLVPAARKMAQ